MDIRYRPFKDDAAEIRALDQAYRAGVIGRGPLLAALAVQRTPSHWLNWARFWLLVYGVALVLAGVVFFFAYNWSAMHRFEKFALIEAGIAACILLAWRSGWRSSLGQAFLVAGAVLVGVLLAVFGQVYQTGADAWQLFFAWAALIFIWALAGNSAALWLLWITVADLAILLNAEQVQPRDALMNMLLLAGAVPLTVLGLREVLLMRGGNWLADAWLRAVLLLAGLVFFSIPAMAGIVDAADEGEPLAWFAGWLALAVAAFCVYRWTFRDVLALTLIVFDAATILLVVIADVLFERGIEEAVLFVFSMIIIGVVGGAYYWLRRLATAMHHESNGMDREVEHASA